MMIKENKPHSTLFSVITPSHNMVDFLPLCCASVSDQGVEHEHIIVDALSNDGTAEWLEKRADLISISESDSGMYDAINKGIELSRGEIISYLNCDEQYLPGALQRVAKIFRQNPQVDILFGNALIINSNGKLLAYRKGYIPRWQYIWASHMYLYTSSMFVRRRVFESGMMFDRDWRSVGDMDFVIKVLRKGFSTCYVKEYFSAFMFTGSNMSDSEHAALELKDYRRTAPWWLQRSAFVFKILMRLEKLLKGAYWQEMPLSYSVFVNTDLTSRSKFLYKSASPFYPR